MRARACVFVCVSLCARTRHLLQLSRLNGGSCDVQVNKIIKTIIQLVMCKLCRIKYKFVEGFCVRFVLFVCFVDIHSLLDTW